MRLLARAFAALALVVALAVPAFAADFTDEQKAALNDRIAQFNAAMSGGDLDILTSSVPPKVMQKIADENKLTLVQLKAAMVAQVQQTMAQVKFMLFSMDLANATYAALPDGMPYVLIPTDSQFDAGAQGKFKAHSTTVAFIEDGTWYMVRVDDATQTQILKDVYPGFASVTFPAGTLEPLTQ